MTQNCLLKNLSFLIYLSGYFYHISRIHTCGVFFCILYDALLVDLSTSVLFIAIYYKKWHLVGKVLSPFTSSYMSSPFLALCCYVHLNLYSKFYWKQNRTKHPTEIFTGIIFKLQITIVFKSMFMVYSSTQVFLTSLLCFIVSTLLALHTVL